MNASLFSEERRAARGGRQLMMLFAVLWLMTSVFGGYLVYERYTKANLTALQRVYLPEYNKSARRSFLPLLTPRSNYWVLIRIVPNPTTKKDDIFICHDEEVVPIFDDDGKIQLTKDGLPNIAIKKNVAPQLKKYGWDNWLLSDKDAYALLRHHIFEGKHAYELLYPSLLGAVIIFIPGMVGASIIKRRLTRRYLRGQPIRGTRELTPKEYERLHRRDTGIGLEVLPHEGGN
jgi:uncharacterized protein YneF (UPF0154 family)